MPRKKGSVNISKSPGRVITCRAKHFSELEQIAKKRGMTIYAAATELLDIAIMLDMSVIEYAEIESEEK